MRKICPTLIHLSAVFYLSIKILFCHSKDRLSPRYGCNSIPRLSRQSDHRQQDTRNIIFDGNPSNSVFYRSWPPITLLFSLQPYYLFPNIVKRARLTPPTDPTLCPPVLATWPTTSCSFQTASFTPNQSATYHGFVRLLTTIFCQHVIISFTKALFICWSIGGGGSSAKLLRKIITLAPLTAVGCPPSRISK